MIGQRLRELRERREMSQGDVEERTGLQRSYISRVESGHTVPTLRTLEMFAKALGVTLHEVVCENGGGGRETYTALPTALTRGLKKPEELFVRRMKNFVGKLGRKERWLLLVMARKLTVKK